MREAIFHLLHELITSQSQDTGLIKRARFLGKSLGGIWQKFIKFLKSLIQVKIKISYKAACF